MSDTALERNKEIVRAQAAAINARDLEGVARTTADDLVRHCQATPGLEIRSRSDFEAFLKSDWAAIPDSVMSIHQIIAESDRVAIFATYEGTQTGNFGPFPPSGKRLALDFAGVFRIANDKVAEIWVTWDNLSALMQLGHFPPPGAEAS